MRTIEAKITKLVRSCLSGERPKSFERKLSKRDRVTYDAESKTVRVYLWNSRIALFIVPPDGGSMASGSISHCGYQTATTKSRLNAILQAFHCGRTNLSQSDFVWHLSIDFVERHTFAEFDALLLNTGRYVFPIHL